MELRMNSGYEAGTDALSLSLGLSDSMTKHRLKRHICHGDATSTHGS